MSVWGKHTAGTFFNIFVKFFWILRENRSFFREWDKPLLLLKQEMEIYRQSRLSFHLKSSRGFEGFSRVLESHTLAGMQAQNVQLPPKQEEIRPRRSCSPSNGEPPPLLLWQNRRPQSAEADEEKNGLPKLRNKDKVRNPKTHDQNLYRLCLSLKQSSG